MTPDPFLTENRLGSTCKNNKTWIFKPWKFLSSQLFIIQDMSFPRKYHQLIEQPSTKTYQRVHILFGSDDKTLGSRKKTIHSRQEKRIKEQWTQILPEKKKQIDDSIWNQYQTLYICEEELIMLEKQIQVNQAVFHQKWDYNMVYSSKTGRIMDFQSAKLKFQAFNFMNTQQQLCNNQY